MSTDRKFVRTGVFATREQTNKINTVLDKAKATPVILIGGVDLSRIEWERAFETIDRFANELGLPKVVGQRYGFDPVNREFLRNA